MSSRPSTVSRTAAKRSQPPARRSPSPKRAGTTVTRGGSLRGRRARPAAPRPRRWRGRSSRRRRGGDVQRAGGPAVDEAIDRIIGLPEVAERGVPDAHPAPVAGRRGIDHRDIFLDLTATTADHRPVGVRHLDLARGDDLADGGDVADAHVGEGLEHQHAADAGDEAFLVLADRLVPPASRRRRTARCPRTARAKVTHCQPPAQVCAAAGVAGPARNPASSTASRKRAPVVRPSAAPQLSMVRVAGIARRAKRQAVRRGARGMNRGLTPPLPARQPRQQQAGDASTMAKASANHTAM